MNTLEKAELTHPLGPPFWEILKIRDINLQIRSPVYG